MTHSLLLLSVIGLAGLIAFVWLVVVAFREHLGWGFAVLLVSPLAAILFAIMHWREAKIPFIAFMTAGIIQLYLVFGVVRDVGGTEAWELAQQVQRGELSEAQASAEFSLRMAERMHRMGAIDDAELEQIRREIEAGPGRAPQDEADIQAMLERIAAKAGKEPAAAETTDQTAANHGDAAAKAEAAAKEPELTLQEHRDIVARKQAEADQTLPPVPPLPKRIDVKQAVDYIGYAMVAVTTDGVRREGVLEAVDDGVLYFTRYLSAGNITFEMRADDIAELELR